MALPPSGFKPPIRWTTRSLLAWTTDRFTQSGIDSPRLSAEMLLAHVIGVPRLKLYIDPDRPASELERAAFRQLVERALKHEPVDYLVGQAPFFSLWFKVTPDVLIPRPSTETLVEHIILHARRTPGFSSAAIADIGTGSGCIAISLAKNLPNSRIIATDLSQATLEIAKENARTHGMDNRIDFRQGDLLSALDGQRVRYLASNPPYISDQEWDEVLPNVKDYEPVTALRGGEDGLKFLRILIEQGPAYIERPGQLLLEIAASQKNAVLELAKANPAIARSRILADHEGLPRILVADVDPP